MSRALDWEREGLVWPHRDTSHFVSAGSTRWHVQTTGDTGKPKLLLLHGTGGSVHSWARMVPLLAEQFDWLAPDLPRHAFTTGHPPEVMSLPRMGSEIAQLLEHLGFGPNLIVGHSAGAALALQLALDHRYTGPIVGLNSALRPFPGPASQLFPAFAKLLFVNPFVPRVFSTLAGRSGEAERFLVRSTGSRIDPEGMACYEALFANSRHTKGALAMMANWDLPTLRTRMDAIANPVLLVHSDKDTAIPLDWAREANSWLPNSRLEVRRGLGHLAHEEAPDGAVELIRAFSAEYLSQTA